MMKLRAFYERQSKGGKWGDDVTVIEEVFVVDILENGKKALVARQGEPYKAPELNYTNMALAPTGMKTTFEIMDMANLHIVDESICPAGVIFTQGEKARTF